MVLWGFILGLAGILAVLVTFLSSLNIFSDMGALGFGAWLTRFFDTQYLSGKKIAFYIGVVLLIVGIVLFIRGKLKAKKSGEQDAATQKGVKYLRDLKGEFKKIIWPTFPSVVRNTGVTLALCAFLGIIICAIDLGLGMLIDLLLKLG